jgi:glutathione synthase/RimK-type ligase-like ATP-grasp enzyme
VVTISNGDRCEVFGALLRMGAHGSVIDNTHAGGVYAPINVKTGIIEIPAIDAHNNHYDAHPDTGKPIKGFHVPEWERIVATCKEASRTIPNIHFAGWDLCVNQKGQVEIIEGNHAPDFDGGMQAPLKIGVKKKLQQTVMNVLGVDPLPLISVWK